MLQELQVENSRLRGDLSTSKESEKAALEEADELRKQLKDWDPDRRNLSPDHKPKTLNLRILGYHGN